jgi:hypothetical protein
VAAEYEPEPGGSNGAAIAPSNTVDHHALLLINPHTSFYFRSELQMTSDEGLNAYGAVTWGQFFVYQGFNERTGWMHTSSGVDAVDEYLETVIMAGFTAERDMGTEGAGSADTAVRNAIDADSVPGPRLRISGNATDILGGHEDAIGYNPEQQVLPNATQANGAVELVRVIRGQFKDGADFVKIYESGRDTLAFGKFATPYQYSEAELAAAVAEAARVGRRVAVHATGEPGAL